MACRITYINDYTLQVRGDYAPNVDICCAKYGKLDGWHLLHVEFGLIQNKGKLEVVQNLDKELRNTCSMACCKFHHQLQHYIWRQSSRCILSNSYNIYIYIYIYIYVSVKLINYYIKLSHANMFQLWWVIIRSYIELIQSISYITMHSGIPNALWYMIYFGSVLCKAWWWLIRVETSWHEIILYNN